MRIAFACQRGGGSMSQRIVQLLIGQIVTDEELRRRFVERPREILTALRDQGVELTKFEIDALVLSVAVIVCDPDRSNLAENVP